MRRRDASLWVETCELERVQPLVVEVELHEQVEALAQHFGRLRGKVENHELLDEGVVEIGDDALTKIFEVEELHRLACLEDHHVVENNRAFEGEQLSLLLLGW